MSGPGAAERTVRRLDRFQQRHAALAFPWAVLQKFGNDQAGSKAALMAYYGLFALFPILLLFTTILGFTLSGNPSLRHRLLDTAFGSFPIIGTQLRSNTHPLTGSGVALAVGIIGTIYGTIGLGQTTQNAVNTVWNIPYVRWPNFVFRNVRALAVIVLLGLAVLGSTILTGLATSFTTGFWATTLAFVGATVLNFGLFLVAFLVLTAEPLKPREVWVGATLATASWQALQLLGSWYVTRVLAHNSDTYGFFAIVITLLSWLYLGAHLFLLSAEVNVVRSYRLWPRSITQPPLTDGDRRTFERLGLMEVRRPEMKISVSFTAEADRDPLGTHDKSRSPDESSARGSSHESGESEPFDKSKAGAQPSEDRDRGSTADEANRAELVQDDFQNEHPESEKSSYKDVGQDSHRAL
ncbi:MAG TPA: YihY/virulence factor BrkB family protein [Acidimicrobiales bacterium]|nr:YihY/virulence factor BrkB family protein [Acidimicrobiales bacterium]